MRIVPMITILALIGGTATGITARSVCRGQPASSTRELEQEVRRLIDDLSGATRDQRAGAEKRLLEMGSRVLPHLPAPELLPSNSVREAVRRIRLELDRRQARESVLPSHVTLDGRRPLVEVLAEISRQTGNVVDGASLPAALSEQPLELSIASVPFWRVIDDLSERLKLRCEYDAGLRGVKFLPPAGGRQEVNSGIGYAGAFRIEALSAARIRRPAGRAAQNGFQLPRDLLRVTLRVRPEPRLRALFLQFAAKEIAVRTADNRELTPLSPEASYDVSLAEGAKSPPIQMDYVVPDDREVARVSLKGKMRCTTAAGNEKFRFSDVARGDDVQRPGVSRRRGGVTGSLNRVARDKREMRIQISVAYEAGGPAFESHRTWFLHNDAYLEDPAGHAFRLNGGTETVQQGEGRLGIEYRFIDLPDPLPDYSFVYVAPTLIVDVPLEFEIESVPAAAKSAAAKVIDK